LRVLSGETRGHLFQSWPGRRRVVARPGKLAGQTARFFSPVLLSDVQRQTAGHRDLLLYGGARCRGQALPHPAFDGGPWRIERRAAANREDLPRRTRGRTGLYGSQAPGGTRAGTLVEDCPGGHRYGALRRGGLLPRQEGTGVRKGQGNLHRGEGAQMKPLNQAFHDFWFKPAPAARLAGMRILVGLFAVWYLVMEQDIFLRVAHTDPRLFAPVGIVFGSPIDPEVFPWVYRATIVAMVFFTLGLWHRVTGLIGSGMLLWMLCYQDSWSMIFHSMNVLVLHAVVLGVTRSAEALSLDA